MVIKKVAIVMHYPTFESTKKDLSLKHRNSNCPSINISQFRHIYRVFPFHFDMSTNQQLQWIHSHGRVGHQRDEAIGLRQRRGQRRQSVTATVDLRQTSRKTGSNFRSSNSQRRSGKKSKPNDWELMSFECFIRVRSIWGVAYELHNNLLQTPSNSTNRASKRNVCS